MTTPNVQELGHPEGHNYEDGSPHLKHFRLREVVLESLRSAVRDILETKGQCDVLEVGAGHGDFSDALVGVGGRLTVTEMSEPSAQALSLRYRNNSAVRVVHDGTGEWLERAHETFDVVVCVSVLHHIPDYLSFLEIATQKINSGGALISWQDPLWYPRRTRASMAVDKGAYFLWRLGQGNYMRGIRTRLRRVKGEYDEANPADMVEYHVVRDGVDEEAIVKLLTPYFSSVQEHQYFSTQSRFLHSLGNRAGITTTFGVEAKGRMSQAGVGG